MGSFAFRLFCRLSTFFWSAVTLAGLGWRWLWTGGRLSRKQPHSPLPSEIYDEFEHGFISLPSGVRLHFAAKGAKHAPLMLLVHGFPEFWYSWRFQLRHFSDSHRVVALDLRGYGESDKPESVDDYHIDILAADIRDMILALGSSSAVLAAHDWGGIISWRVAMLFPEVISRLIILNCPHPTAYRKLLRVDRSQILRSWYIFMFQTPWLPEFSVASEDFKMLDEMFRGKKAGIRSIENFTDVDLDAWKYTFSLPGALTPPINFYRAMMYQKYPPVKADPRIKVPTLVVWGEDDAFLVPKLGQMSAEECLDGRCCYVEKASHWVQQDKPEKVNELIRRFLSDKRGEVDAGQGDFVRDPEKAHL